MERLETVDYVRPVHYVPTIYLDRDDLVIQDDDDSAKDVIKIVNGADKDDAIALGLNDDFCLARDGDDLVWGGTGHDVIFGENGNDRRGISPDQEHTESDRVFGF